MHLKFMFSKKVSVAFYQTKKKKNIQAFRQFFLLCFFFNSALYVLDKCLQTKKKSGINLNFSKKNAIFN